MTFSSSVSSCNYKENYVYNNHGSYFSFIQSDRSLMEYKRSKQIDLNFCVTCSLWPHPFYSKEFLLFFFLFLIPFFGIQNLTPIKKCCFYPTTKRKEIYVLILYMFLSCVCCVRWNIDFRDPGVRAYIIRRNDRKQNPQTIGQGFPYITETNTVITRYLLYLLDMCMSM